MDTQLHTAGMIWEIWVGHGASLTPPGQGGMWGVNLDGSQVPGGRAKLFLFQTPCRWEMQGVAEIFLMIVIEVHFSHHRISFPSKLWNCAVSVSWQPSPAVFSITLPKYFTDTWTQILDGKNPTLSRKYTSISDNTFEKLPSLTDWLFFGSDALRTL